MAKKVTGYIKLQIPAGKATPAPPVGPALGQHGVNIRMIGTSEIRVTVLVDEKDVDKAMRAAHDRFIED